MPDTSTVIVATDGSDHSLRVLPHANALAASLGASIDFVRVVERADLDGNGDAAAQIERARARIEAEMAADLERFGINGAVKVLVAGQGEDPASVLLRLGDGGTVFAMHSRGRGGLARILQGSVALGVLKQINQPVLLGGPELLPPPASGGTYRLVVCTDLSPDADYALKAVAPLLEAGKIDVTLLYVHLHAPGGVDNEAQKAEREAVLRQKRTLLPASATVDVVLREIPIGAGVDTAIMEVAQQTGAHAIAMATHGHSARHHLLMGSVALSVLGRSRLPILVARAHG